MFYDLPKSEGRLGQKIEDIRILTDYYHCTNKDENLNEMFVQDYAIVLVLENKQICFEHFSIFDECIYITYFEFYDLPKSEGRLGVDADRQKAHTVCIKIPDIATYNEHEAIKFIRDIFSGTHITTKGKTILYAVKNINEALVIDKNNRIWTIKK